MTQKTRGLWWLIGGALLLILCGDVLIKILLVVYGLYMIDRGMRLRGQFPLFERIRAFISTL